MKNKKKLLYLNLFLALFFYSSFFALKTSAATPEELCRQSGGSGLQFLTGRCKDCPADKTESGGVCIPKENVTAGGPSDYNPNAGTASQGQNLFGRPLVDTQPRQVKFNYKLLENFPGFFTKGQVMTDFPAFVSALYKFGVWTVGLAATFMLVIGGFMYMTSAGNNSRASSAKGVINDALIGLVVALAAYLLLYVINPDLVKLNPDLVSVEVKEFKPSQYGTGKCEPSNTELCSVEALRNYFDNQIKDPNIDANKWAAEASSICNLESGGKELAESGTDFCQNDSVSMGLFQINISAHAIGGLTCNNAFNTPFVAGGRYKCKVINPSLYGQCMQKAKTASINLQKAWSLFKSSGYSWSQWGANTICKFPKGSTKK